MDADTKLVTEALKQNAGFTVASGVALLLLGALAVMAPLLTGVAVTVLVGIFMLAAGITRGAFAFRAQSFGKGLLMFLLGAVVAVGGILLLTRPLIGLASLTVVLAAFFAADGVIEIFYDGCCSAASSRFFWQSSSSTSGQSPEHGRSVCSSAFGSSSVAGR